MLAMLVGLPRSRIYCMYSIISSIVYISPSIHPFSTVAGAYPSCFQAEGRPHPELVASQLQAAYIDKQAFTTTSTPSLSGYRSHAAGTQVRRGYHFTIRDSIVYMLSPVAG